MLDSILIAAVRESVEAARDYASSCMGIQEGDIAVEILEFNEDGEREFSFMITRPFGKAKQNRKYCDFLENEVSDAHHRLLHDDKPLPVSWEKSPIVYEYRNLSYENNKGSYSVLIGVLGGSERQNRRLAESIADDISK